jgi:NAD(P)-dependent dehydrogenase (short-subunit alcohol dehydrogenase family)
MAIHTSKRTALIVGASRGLGLALAKEYLKRGWQVIATVRGGGSPGGLHALQAASNGALEIESVDITVTAQIDALRDRLQGRSLDLLFVNAGVTNRPAEKIGEVSTEEFVRILTTNSLSPLRVVERLIDGVAKNGSVAVMSSHLGSVAANTTGDWEVYRASKAALNTLMRSLAARRADDSRTLLLIAPGWVRTDMGGDDAPLDAETAISGVIDAIESRRGAGGLTYVDYRNQIVPW